MMTVIRPVTLSSNRMGAGSPLLICAIRVSSLCAVANVISSSPSTLTMNSHAVASRSSSQPTS